MRIIGSLSSKTCMLSTLFSIFSANAALAFDNWYPSSITPPAGHRYPCALTALPASLDGIPEADRQFINHTYSMILKCLQAKMLMLDSLYQNRRSYASEYSAYYSAVTAARKKILDEPCPRGLEGFKNDVIQALDQQIVFFRKAVEARQTGESMQKVLGLAEGRAASGLLQAAWSKMANRYPQWSQPVRESIYHHLCALDLF